MHDWMHLVLVQGILNTALYLCMEAFAHAEIPHSKFHDYIQHFTWPKHIKGDTAARDVFSPTRVKNSRKAHTAKLMASEALNVFPIVALHVALIIRRAGRCVDACRVIETLAKLLELLQELPHGTVAWTEVDEHAEEFLTAFVFAFGIAYLHPKFHGMLHPGDELRRFGFLLSCWVQERKHKMIKGYATEVRNTRVFEQSINGDCICENLQALWAADGFDFNPGLINGRAVGPSLEADLRRYLGIDATWLTFSMATSARFSRSGTCTKGDVVIVTGYDGNVVAGVIELLFEAADMLLVIVDTYTRHTFDVTLRYAIWTAPKALQLYPLGAIIAPVISKRGADDSLLTLLPRRVCK